MMLDDMKLDETGRQERLTRPALAVELADRLHQMIVSSSSEWSQGRNGQRMTCLAE